MAAGLRPLAVLDAPSNLGLMPPAPGREPGVKRLAAALRAAGLVRRLRAREAGSVQPPPYDPERDPATGVRNLASIAGYSAALADGLGEVFAAGERALVLGGDCSILLGCALALRRRGRYGLVFVDGHADFLSPELSGTGGAAGMDLALVTGHGPAALTDLEGLRPLVPEVDAAALAYRHPAEPLDPEDAYARSLAATDIVRRGLVAVRRAGLGRVAQETLDRFAGDGYDGFWVHLDADVLDSTVMPAVDSPQPDGLTCPELLALLHPLVTSPRCLGLDVTIYDPDLDATGEIGRTFADALVAVLTPTHS